MFKNIIFTKWSASVIIFGSISILLNVNTENEQSFNDRCIRRYLQSRFIQSCKEDVAQPVNKKKNFFQKIHEKFIVDEFPLCPSSEYEHVSFLMKTLSRFYSDEHIISLQGIKDLDIINQDQKDVCASLESILKLKTKSGKTTLFLSLLHPTTDTEKIEQKQKLIKLFIEHPEFITVVEQLLEDMQQGEEKLLTLLTYDFIKKEVEHTYFSRIPYFGEMLNQSPLFCSTSLIGSFSGGIAGLFFFMVRSLLSVMDFKDFFKKIEQNPILMGNSIVLAPIFLYFGLINIYKDFVTVPSKSKQLQYQFKDVSLYLEKISDLSKIAENVSFLQQQPLFLSLIETMFSNQSLNDLKYFLRMPTFSSSISAVHHWGNVFVAYQKLKNIHESVFIELFHLIGQLDVALSIAKIMRAENENDKLHFCFAQFKKSEKPIFEIYDSWHPLLLQHKTQEEIVLNSMNFKDEIKNIILTGPNTCGKTAITTGFAISVLLAQSLGIAPASECILTPFDTVYVILTIRSDSGIGDSRFKSEIREMKLFLDHLQKSIIGGKFTFAVLDEIFTGTNPRDGEIAAREFLKYFLQKNLCSHSVMILSTHYHLLTDIAQRSSSCANYKVDAHRTSNGTIIRNFRIIPGVSLMNIALDLLKSEGLLVS